MEDSNRNFKLQTCEDFIEVLASKAAVPGGGGAAALTGAIGIALGNMVGSLTVGKKTYADVEDEIIECKKEADEIAKEFLELMDKDAEAFEPLSKAYGLPKSIPEEIAEKEEIQIDDTEFEDYVSTIVSNGGYGDAATLYSNYGYGDSVYGKNQIRVIYLAGLVLDKLAETAEVTENAVEENTESVESTESVDSTEE